MLSRNNSYFDPELRIDGHYILTGNTNDHFCNDNLVITDILQELHRYLREEEGFEAVFFLDTEQMVYCMDEHSFAILTGAQRQPGTQGQQGSRGGEIVATGPLGRRRRRTQSEGSQQAAPRTTADRRLHLGRMSLGMAWNQVASILRRGEQQCALVVCNANNMRGGEKLLEELSSFSITNHSVVINVFRETNMNNVAHWNEYARNVLLPRMNAADPESNRVISLCTPNRWEVRNLLNSLRLDETRSLQVEPGDIEPLGEVLASACARNDWSLVRLINRLENYARAHPDQVLSMSSWPHFTEERNYRPPMEELEGLIGQNALKERIRMWCATQVHRRGRGQRDVENRYSSRLRPIAAASRNNRLGHKLNAVIKGAPGTGKSTIAQIIGRLYHDLGLLPQGQVVPYSVGQIVTSHPGESAQRMSQAVQAAMGSVLFIDEAYALAQTLGGREAIDQLVDDMSRYEGQFAVLLAGYPRDMDELMQVNPGLPGRFPEQYVLEDYSAEELRDIFYSMAASDPEGVQLSRELMDISDDLFPALYGGRGRDWNNAREMQNLLVEMKKLANLRAVAEGEAGRDIVLTIADIPENLRHCTRPRSRSIPEALEQIDQMIGLHGVKRFLRELAQRVRIGVDEKVPGNFIFSGPPGTGKTTVARRMGELMGLLGVLSRKTNNVTECTAEELLNGSITLEEAVGNARGGVFFLDEAHQLAESDRGRQIIRALVPIIENPQIHADTCFICAGYHAEMERFLQVDPGLNRRFPELNRIRFVDYTSGELVQILEEMARDRGQIPSEGYLYRARLALDKYMEERDAYFGNGGFIRDTFLPGSIAARTRRLNLRLTGAEDAVAEEEQVALLSDEERRTLTEYDLPAQFAPLAGPVGRYVALDERTALARVEALLGKDEIVAFARSRANADAENGFFDENISTGLHYAIVGPTGSGRHTAARALAHLWQELGLLESDHVEPAGKGKLEAGWVGQTNIKVGELVAQHVGGTLLIEYPSSLLPQSDTDNSFGPEAMGALMSAMSTYRGRMSMVFIDSQENMDAVLQAFPTLRKQLAGVFQLEDLSPAHMAEIFRQKSRDGIALEPELQEMIPDFFLNWVSDRGGLGDASAGWSNGAEVDRLIGNLKTNWENGERKTRVETIEENSVTYTVTRRYVTREHIPPKLRRYLKRTSVVSSQAKSKLMELPGLDRVKESIFTVERRIRRLGGRVKPGCYLYMGNPGVGKTTVAKYMGGVLKSTGVLEQGHVVVRTARQMGEAFHQFEHTLKLAKNGILFIDEAHQLAEGGNPFGNEVIKRLLTVLEDDEVTNTTCIILAGYPRPMLELLQRDEGLASRFGTEESMIFFDDYTAEELLEVMDYMAARADSNPSIGASVPLRLSDEFRQRSLEVFRTVLARGDKNFGNARFVRNYLHDALNAQILRFDREYGVDGQPAPEALDLLVEQDIPARYAALAETTRPRAVIRGGQVKAQRGEMITEVNYEQSWQRLAQSVVLLEVMRGGQWSSTGTGTIVTESGIVLTCAHVVRDAQQVRARVWCPGMVGGDVRWFDAQLMEPVCADCDMAVVKMKGSNFVPASIRPVDEPIHNGEKTLLLGFPLGSRLTDGDRDSLRISNFDGRVSSLQERRGTQIAYIDSTGLHGNSGSPVFSLNDGRVIGVFSGSIVPDRQRSLDELNYFYPIRYFWDRFVSRDPFWSRKDEVRDDA